MNDNGYSKKSPTINNRSHSSYLPPDFNDLLTPQEKKQKEIAEKIQKSIRDQIAALVKELREMKGWTGTQVADKLKINTSRYYDFEKNNKSQIKGFKSLSNVLALYGYTLKFSLEKIEEEEDEDE